MTGPAEGKLPLDCEVYFSYDDKKIRIKEVSVYIHLKGYALARVTHLDIEHPSLNKLIQPKHGKFLTVKGFEGGIEIVFEEKTRKKIVFDEENLKPRSVKIFSPLLNMVLQPNVKTRTWIGGKFGGIYIGFRKPEVRKLEKIAETYFKMSPIKP
ncbi:hypothetical protein CW703_05375 [Candidatus Bathyarchaeota archaeon]|nr:MAG: hypothetical protein CW703_05375 [Candidatus Bathyarchaeota archaeon]